MNDFSTLISAPALLKCLTTKTPAALVVFDCRHDLANPEFGANAYALGHIPGARFLHLDRDLSGVMTGRNGRHPLPDRDTFLRKMAQSGVAPTTAVVAYDDASGMFAARLWWLLRWVGHTRVAVLDGGLQAWGRAGGALEAGACLSTAETSPQALPATPGAEWVDADLVLANLGTAEALVVDARSPDRYRGENETLDPVGGHIPGAVNRFFRDNLERIGTFKLPGVLRAEFTALLAGRAPQTVIHQCGSGVTACHNLLAMEHAGLHGSRLYPGSWSEWCADPARPVATGAG